MCFIKHFLDDKAESKKAARSEQTVQDAPQQSEASLGPLLCPSRAWQEQRLCLLSSLLCSLLLSLPGLLTRQAGACLPVWRLAEQVVQSAKHWLAAAHALLRWNHLPATAWAGQKLLLTRRSNRHCLSLAGGSGLAGRGFK